MPTIDHKPPTRKAIEIAAELARQGHGEAAACMRDLIDLACAYRDRKPNQWGRSNEKDVIAELSYRLVGSDPDHGFKQRVDYASCRLKLSDPGAYTELHGIMCAVEARLVCKPPVEWETKINEATKRIAAFDRGNGWSDRSVWTVLRTVLHGLRGHEPSLWEGYVMLQQVLAAPDREDDVLNGFMPQKPGQDR